MTSLRRLWSLLTMPCRGVIDLTSQSMERPLPRLELAAIRLHAVFCTACRRYRRQIGTLRQAIRRYTGWIETADPEGLPKLSPEARTRIKKALAES